MSRSRPAYWVLSAFVVLAVTACADTQETPEEGDFAPIPTRPVPTATTPPLTTDAAGALAVVEFAAPETFTCLAEDPAQALVTLGWSVPSATAVRLTLDGQELATGLQEQLPYQVPAGGARGVGAAVAIDCDGPPTRTITITWTADGVQPAQRDVTITKEQTNG